MTGVAPFRPDSFFGTIKNLPDLLRMTRPAQRYATNRALPPPNASPIRRALPPSLPGITQQAPNYSPVIDALSQGPTGAPMSPIDPQTEEIVRALMQ